MAPIPRITGAEPTRGSVNAEPIAWWRVARIFVMVLAFTIVVGAFVSWRLSDYRSYADDVQDRFARNGRYIGELQVLAAQLRAIEAASLAPAAPATDSQQDLKTVDARWALVRHSYEHVPHGFGEARAYARLVNRWAAYRRAADTVISTSSAGRAAEAASKFQAESAAAYSLVDQSLDDLSDENMAGAAVAAAKADAAFRASWTAALAALGLGALAAAGGLVQWRGRGSRARDGVRGR